MTAHTRSMVACLEDAFCATDAFFEGAFVDHHAASPNDDAVVRILFWQRAKACRDQRLAMQIEDDKTLDELEQIERETRLAARSACEAVGIDWRTLGDVA